MCTACKRFVSCTLPPKTNSSVPHTLVEVSSGNHAAHDILCKLYISSCILALESTGKIVNLLCRHGTLWHKLTLLTTHQQAPNQTLWLLRMTLQYNQVTACTAVFVCLTAFCFSSGGSLHVDPPAAVSQLCYLLHATVACKRSTRANRIVLVSNTTTELSFLDYCHFVA